MDDLKKEILLIDLEQKKIELEIKKAELKIVLDKKRSIFPTTVIVGILVAVIGVFGNMGVSYYNGKNTRIIEKAKSENQRLLENQKFQSTLILEAIKTGNPEKAVNNLEFFIDIGFLDDDENKISSYIKTKGKIPVLPAQMIQSSGGACPSPLCPCADGGCSKACCGE